MLKPTITSTFDASKLVTRTPAPPAQCPVEKPEKVLNFNLPTDEFFYLNQPILEFLNAGGTRKAAITAYQLRDKWADDRIIREMDVTGDGVLELLFTEMGGFLHVYLCVNGQYELQTPLTETWHSNQPYIISLRDLNQDGVYEIVTMAGDDRARDVDIFEWNGSEFQNLNWQKTEGFDQPCANMYGPSSVEIVDVDGNGTLELILEQAIPIWSEYIEGLPWRKETRTCTWNGEAFVLTRTDFAPPIYRFQAVQDGDRAALMGEYERAIDLYRQSVFSDRLQWWSEDRHLYETWLAVGENSTPQPTPVPDLIEYDYLAAYARFRIMLLHILRGYLSDAKIVYDTLQAKFPDGKPGHEYAEMAMRFWDEYQVSTDIGSACEKAIEYAANHPNILTYLGSSYHGWQSHIYVAEDVCPFQQR